jgi:hypothetical protein
VLVAVTVAVTVSVGPTVPTAGGRGLVVPGCAGVCVLAVVVPARVGVAVRVWVFVRVWAGVGAVGRVAVSAGDAVPVGDAVVVRDAAPVGRWEAPSPTHDEASTAAAVTSTTRETSRRHPLEAPGALIAMVAPLRRAASSPGPSLGSC